jgi:hypothetical protein
MNTQEQRQQMAQEHKAAQVRVVAAYHHVFNSPDGEIVLEDLRRSFGLRLPAFIPVATRPGSPLQYDDIYGKIRDGQRSVFLHIEAKLEASPAPEADIEVFTGVTNE